MIEHGYNRTSVDQVIEASSSSKGAFFHHFDSKADLATALVKRYVAGDLAYLDAGLAACADVDDPAQRVVAFLRYYEDRADELMAEQSGCLYATVLAEREFTGSEIRTMVEDAAVTWRRAIVDLLRPAFEHRRPGIDTELDDLADHLYTTFEGGFIMCRTVEDPGAMGRQLRVFRQMVEVLLRLA